MNAHQPPDALPEVAGPAARYGQGRHGEAHGFHGGQGGGVVAAIAAGDGRQIVAALLALQIEAAGQPPHAGMIEQDGLHDGLQEQGGVIMPPHVGQFMGENRLDLRHGQAGQQGRRKQDHGFEESQHQRYIHPHAADHPHRPPDPQPHGHPPQRLMDVVL